MCVLQDGHHLHQLCRRKSLRQGANDPLLISTGEQRFSALRGCFADEQITDQSGDLAEQGAHVLAVSIELIQGCQSPRCILSGHTIQQAGRFSVTRQTQHIQNDRFRKLPLGATALIEQRQAIPQSPVGQSGQQFCGL